MALITCNNLSLGYGSHTVAENLNFTVNEGDYLCIAGENGAGKSTLMKTILNLLEPKGGQLLTGEGLKANGIGYLPQHTAVQKDFPATVREIVLSGCQGRRGLRPFYSRDDKKLADINIERMGITELSSCCYRELSGGQQQRALLARALCAAGKILLLDEPVSGLDMKAAADMYNLIKGLNDSGVTIIIISHDMQIAVKYASHILHIGKTHFFGTTEKYLQSGKGRNFLAENGGDTV